MLTKAELTEKNIKEMAQAGATFSRHCRNPWTGEKTKAALSGQKYTGKRGYLNLILQLKGDGILGYSDTAGLDTYYLAKQDQHTWTAQRWEKEIRQRMP